MSRCIPFDGDSNTMNLTYDNKCKNYGIRDKKMVYCTRCGAVVATQTQVQALENVLEGRGPKIREMLRLCEDCKAKEVIGEPNVIFLKS